MTIVFGFTVAELISDYKDKKIYSCIQRNMQKKTKKSSQGALCPVVKDERRALCPVCQGGYRHFYTILNDKIILFCAECFCIWSDPKNIEIDGTDDILTIYELFDKKTHHSTGQEVNKSKWNTIQPIDFISQVNALGCLNVIK